MKAVMEPMPSPAILEASTFSNIPCFVPRGVLWYTVDTDLLYIGTGISNSSGSPGVTLIGGGGTIVLTSEQFINTTSPETISITSPATQMYALSIYMATLGNGTTGQTVTATVSYTAVGGIGAQTITLILPLSSANVVMETYPLLALGGTSISTTTAYGGAYSPSYTIGASIVQMPA
jgi:hypothetical protein